MRVGPSDVWNELPIEQRKRLSGFTIQQQIRDIEIEKKRAKAAHQKHISECDEHLKYLRASLARWHDDVNAQ